MIRYKMSDMIRFIGTYPIPQYLICALVNGDYSGLEPEDIDLLDTWLAYNFPNGFVVNIEEDSLNNPYFTSYPEVVHVAADVVDVDFFIDEPPCVGKI